MSESNTCCKAQFFKILSSFRDCCFIRTDFVLHINSISRTFFQCIKVWCVCVLLESLLLFFQTQTNWVVLFFPQVTLLDGGEGLEAKVGEEVRLTCKVAGFPVPKVQWFKNNSPIRSSDIYNMSKGPADEAYSSTGAPQENHSLLIYSARIIDSGSYKCRLVYCGLQKL